MPDDPRGTRTSNGFLLGTVWVNRSKRLTRAEAEAHADAYLQLGHEVYTNKDQRDNIVTKLEDSAIGFLYEKKKSPIKVPAQTIGGVTIPGYEFQPPSELVTILAEDLYRQL